MKKQILTIFNMIEENERTSDAKFVNKCVIHKDDTFTIIIEPRMINKVKLTEKDLLAMLLDNEARRDFYCVEVDYKQELYLVIRGIGATLGFPVMVTDDYNHTRDVHEIRNLKDIPLLNDDVNQTHVLIEPLIRIQKMISEI